MNPEQIASLVATLTGQLHATNTSEENDIHLLQQTLAETLNHQDISSIRNQQYSIDGSDIFSEKKILPARLNNILEIAKGLAEKKSEEAVLRVFVRDVPVKTTQIVGSIPDWAAGATLEKSFGPFTDAEGRLKWFDFYKIVKLIALYTQGEALPSILFSSSFFSRLIHQVLPPELVNQYSIAEGSVWIRASLLCPTAPTDRFCGLKVKDGTIHLDSAPQNVGNKLVIQTNNTVKVHLNVEQPIITNSGSSLLGIDARNAHYQLPSSFSFSYTGLKNTLQQIGPASWQVYGNTLDLNFVGNQSVEYDAHTGRVLIPMHTKESVFSVANAQSPFLNLSGKASIEQSYWGIAAASLDIANPLAADGNGSFLVKCGKGLQGHWKTGQGNDIFLVAPSIMGEPGRIDITDLFSNGLGATQHLNLWKDLQNLNGTSLDLSYKASAPWMYTSMSAGEEILITVASAQVNIDRPVKVNGEPVAVRSKESLVLFGLIGTTNLIYLLDENLLAETSTSLAVIIRPKPISLALENALFTVSPPNGVLLFGNCTSDFTQILSGNLLLSFELFSYLPSLPDPYVANLDVLKRQFLRGNYSTEGSIWLWLICLVQFKPNSKELDEVNVSFHFGKPSPSGNQNALSISSPVPIQNTSSSIAAQLFSPNPVQTIQPISTEMVNREATLEFTTRAFERNPNKDYQQEWESHFSEFEFDAFSLLDVSSNANQMGISFGVFGNNRLAMLKTSTVATSSYSNDFPLQVEEMHVVSQGQNVRAFTLPLVAWEPVFNLSYPENPQVMDPPLLWNYYPDDGGPTRIFNNSVASVPLAPIPLVDFIISEFKKNKNNSTLAIFTLPFGLRALADMSLHGPETTKPLLDTVKPSFPNDLAGGIQIKAWAGNYDVKPAVDPSQKDSRMFPGYILQTNTIRGLDGTETNASNLGDSVTRIFNGEFFETPLSSGKPELGRGVPITRIDFTGYGANMFSNWFSPSAQIAATSQARFEIMMGRTAQEVIQVKSICYPSGARFVRTITLFRTSSGYVYRVDSGWKAESDGIFDFRFSYIANGTPKPPDYPATPYPTVEKKPYTIHPGIIKGFFNIQNIREDSSLPDFKTTVTVNTNELYINGITGFEEINSGPPFEIQVLCRPVWFDCDIEMENVVLGHTGNRVPAKKVLGYVQLAPTGVPLSDIQFRDLLNSQFGSIGGPVNCVIDINKSGQQMRINRVDVNTSIDHNGNIAFVAAARGNVFLPKDGSWSMVQHSVGTGEVTPLDESITVPLTRKGEWVKDLVVNPADVANNLVSITHPIDLLRDINPDTVNFAFLQSTATQKALFLTPSYAQGITKLLSKAPPIFSDAYRLMSGNGIFPNIGNAVNNYGKAIALATSNGVAAFTEKTLADASKVLEVLEINAEKQGAEVIKQGMNLLQKGADNLVNKALQFDIPDLDIPLVQMDGLKIYIDYKTKKEKTGANQTNSQVNFDVNSFADKMADQWKGRLNNLSMVVDLGSIQRLMIIKGNFESRKGTESGYEGDQGGLGGLPIPEIEFNEKLQPVIDLLQMLGELSSGNYADALKRGLKIAMSNSGEIWQYKFEASKTIPVLRFPPTDIAYNDPNCPLKLEASLGLGVYFNAALKITTDPKQLLPTAGAYLQFYGSMSVMCISVSVGTIYAVGSVNVKIACDTQSGPSLLLKFGFGAQIVVGLPVVGNVSVLYMMGVEIYAGTDKITLAGFLLFRGQANLIGGLVSVTITIEAKGVVERTANATNCIASVTFALDISIFLVIDIDFSRTWSESRQIA